MTILANEAESEGSWASLPVLLLWMIKDKLDIFDNWRFPAVCRNWLSASQCYPKILQSVGDGLPWVFQWIDNRDGSSRELISVTRERKLTLDLPEFARSKVLFSKEGWLLLNRDCYLKRHVPHRLLLVNPFTRVKTELPGLLSYCDCLGYFTTRDGSPHCVYLFSSGGCKVKVREARPGDQAWTTRVFHGKEQRFCNEFYSFIVIGDNVYCQDWEYVKMVFNLANNSWKCLPETMSPYDYFVDVDGKCVFFELSDTPKRSSFTFYRYNDGGFSWEALNNDQVMDTSWFYSFDYCYNCIVAKGKGVKVYLMTKTNTYDSRGRRVPYVEVHDLVTGSCEILRLPFELRGSPHWVALG